MQIYKVPYNFKHEEKVFGGYVSIRQAIYLVLAASMVSILFIPVINIFFKSIIFLIFSSIFIMFAFVKFDETNADRYFIYVLNFLFRKKKYILEEGKR